MATQYINEKLATGRKKIKSNLQQANLHSSQWKGNFELCHSQSSHHSFDVLWLWNVKWCSSVLLGYVVLNLKKFSNQICENTGPSILWFWDRYRAPFPIAKSVLFIRPSSDGTYYGMVMSVRPSVRPGLRPSIRPSVRPSVRHSFPHFSPTCFDILIWNFVYHFIFMHVRSSSNAINFRHFLQELCSFLTSNSYKYAVFRTFLLHALTYWVQILCMTLF